MKTTPCHRTGTAELSGRIFSIILALMLIPGRSFGAADPKPPPPPPCTNTMCDAVSTNISVCGEGSVLLMPVTNVICGLPITVSATKTNLPGLVIKVVNYSNSCGFACSDTFTTNKPIPSLLTPAIWVDSPSGITGTTLSAQFRPTAQSGSVTFKQPWKHTACDADVDSAITTVAYNIPCPTITKVLAYPPPPNTYGASFIYPFKCAGGWYFWEDVSWVTNSSGSTPTILTVTNAIFISGNGVPGDAVIDGPYPPTSNKIEVTQQTLYFALVGGGGTTNNNSVCSFSNTQTLQVIVTNAPSTPAHGKIITSVTIGGGLSVTNTF
jgi:hypothetical protein